MDKANVTAAQSSEASETAPVTMLVIEDNLVFRRMLGHYAKKDGHRYLEAASLHELRQLRDALADVQVVWVDLNLDQETAELAVAYFRKQNPYASIILMSAASEAEVSEAAHAYGVDYFAVKPIPYDLFRVLTGNANRLWRRKKSGKVNVNLQNQLGRLVAAFYQDSPGERLDYIERILVLTATALNAALDVSSVAAFAWDGNMGGNCLMAWGQTPLQAGARITDGNNLFKIASLQGPLSLRRYDVQMARNSYLKKIIDHSACIVPCGVAASGSGLIWILARQDGRPFSDTEIEAATNIVRLASFTALAFDRYIRLEAGLSQAAPASWQEFAPPAGPQSGKPQLQLVSSEPLPQ